MAFMKRLLFCSMLVLVAAICSAAQQRPLLTDDVDITTPGALDIGVGVDFFQDAKFPLSGLRGELTRVGDIRIGHIHPLAHFFFQIHQPRSILPPDLQG